MPYVILSDTHCHPHPGPVLPDGRNQRLCDIIACMDAALALAVKHKAALIHGGDLFHDRKGVKPEASDAVAEWLDRVRQARVELHVLVGNHDMSITGDGSNSVKIIRGSGAVPHAALERVDIQGHCFGFLPYTTDPKLVRESATRLRGKNTTLIGHLGIGDPKYSNCVPVDYEVPGKISVADLLPDEFTSVFLGHYHNPQTLGKNVRYIGSPLQLSFKECGQRRGVWLYDPAKGRCEFVQNTTSPAFLKMPAEEAVAKAAHGEIAETDHLWVTGATSADVAAFASLDRRAVTRVDRAVKSAPAARLKASSNDKELLTSFYKHSNPAADSIDASRAVEVAIQLLEEA
jgi:DNA repair exonuclease SbcCD nuclease subunit